MSGLRRSRFLGSAQPRGGGRRAVGGRQRGSVFVEFLFFLPVVILIWTLLTFIYQAKGAAVATQRDARECAWTHALRGCSGGLPARCQGGSARSANDVLMRASANELRTVASEAPQTIPNLANLHGRYFAVESDEAVQRPAVLGGTTVAKGRFATMCADDPPIKWNVFLIFAGICRQHGESSWCL
ncbi:MAG: hypothetical protein GY811_05290 [Myxococcales bacterium]|nr:hypothetical protein [Myxococcales bacterium]